MYKLLFVNFRKKTPESVHKSVGQFCVQKINVLQMIRLLLYIFTVDLLSFTLIFCFFTGRRLIVLLSAIKKIEEQN